MFESLTSIPAEGLGLSAIVGALILMLFTGHIVIRKVYTDALEQRNEWRKAHETSEEARKILLGHNTMLLQVVNTQTTQGDMSVAHIRSVRDAAHSLERGE